MATSELLMCDKYVYYNVSPTHTLHAHTHTTCTQTPHAHTPHVHTPHVHTPHAHTQLMLLIGEGFADSSDQVCGAVVQVRNRGDKLAIWTADQNRESDVRNIGYVGVVYMLHHCCNS